MFNPLTLVGLHTWISLVAIAAGIAVVLAFVTSRPASRATTLFLATAILTSATGFILPASGFLPSHGVGILALVVLIPTVAALYQFRLAGRWNAVYVVGTVVSLYLLVFVAVAQAFQKVPALTRLAPTGSEPPFLVAQLATLGLFVVLGFVAVRASRKASDGALPV